MFSVDSAVIGEARKPLDRVVKPGREGPRRGRLALKLALEWGVRPVANCKKIGRATSVCE